MSLPQLDMWTSGQPAEGYRTMTDVDRAQVDNLQSHGVRTCHIMGYMVGRKGGHSSVIFATKDLHNYFDEKMRTEIKDGDVVATLSYIRGKYGCDPYMYSQYQLGPDGKLQTLFWVDSTCRTDYLCLGDVVAFDSTYKRNKYNYPLVFFFGCNHHSQTVIFGAALVSDETIESYKWVLTCFLEAMGNKQPKAVVMDGAMSMKDAIRTVFRDASHRLCTWHLHKNAFENVEVPTFVEDFKKAMYMKFTPGEFEEFWASMVAKHDLQGNQWVSNTYNNKTLWATAYFCDKFFARIRTTSQCETINGLVEAYVRKRCNIFEFMQNFDHVLSEYTNNEPVADFKSMFTQPVLTTGLYSIERHAATMYTAEIFKEVRQELVNSSPLIVSERVEEDANKVKFKLTKFYDTDYVRNVVNNTSESTTDCECRLFESRGLPCSHIFVAMKEQHINCIPESLILTRWTKNAKNSIIPTDLSGESMQIR